MNQQIDLGAIIDCLMRSDCEEDDIALAAIREANSLLFDLQLDWRCVFNSLCVDDDDDLAAARNFRMPFGKYNGLVLGEIEKRDFAYLKWLNLRDTITPPLGTFVEKIVQTHQ